MILKTVSRVYQTTNQVHTKVYCMCKISAVGNRKGNSRGLSSLVTFYYCCFSHPLIQCLALLLYWLPFKFKYLLICLFNITIDCLLIFPFYYRNMIHCYPFVWFSFPLSHSPISPVNTFYIK